MGTGSYGDVGPCCGGTFGGKPVPPWGIFTSRRWRPGQVLTTPALCVPENCRRGVTITALLCKSLPQGRYRSRQMDDVLYEARNLAADGVKELIVVAQDFGASTALTCRGTSGF